MAVHRDYAEQQQQQQHNKITSFKWSEYTPSATVSLVAMSSTGCHLEPHGSRRPQRPLQQQPAAKGSLRGLLLQHSSKRLYVHPLQWTSLYLSLLCCVVINDQINAHHCCLSQGPWRKDTLELWKELRHLKTVGSRDNHSRQLIHCLGLNAQQNCQIGPGTLALRYNQKPVCHLQLPFMARYNQDLLWAYIDSSWIDKLHQKHRPRENVFLARAKRAVGKENLPISPFCVAVLLAMAQQTPPGQQVTLILFDHEKPSDSDKIISTFYEYKLKASQTYLSKFDQPYAAFESDLIIHRRVIPLKQNMLKVLSDALQRAAAGPGKQAEPADTDFEAVIANSLYPVGSTKRKALDESDSNIVAEGVQGAKRCITQHATASSRGSTAVDDDRNYKPGIRGTGTFYGRSNKANNDENDDDGDLPTIK